LHKTFNLPACHKSGWPAAQLYNFRRNQSRPFSTSPQIMEYDLSPPAGLLVPGREGGALVEQG
jgi:hypothetical protein